MKIIKSEESNWQKKEGYSKKIFFDRTDDKKIVIQQIRIKPGETANSHYHKFQTEVFYFLNSNGFWTVNGLRLEPNTGDVLVIEPNDKHEVMNNTIEDYLYMAFKYDCVLDDFYTD